MNGQTYKKTNYTRKGTTVKSIELYVVCIQYGGGDWDG